MNIISSNRFFFTVLLLFMLSENAVFAKNMFRWVDENGNVRYSDQVPPDQVKHKRDSLNDNIRVVDTVKKEKTEAQRELEKRLLLLRKQQDDIINQQKARDKVLLSSFRNEDDITLSLKTKMLALTGQRNVLDGNLLRVKKQLQLQQKRAAQFERDGKSPPKYLLKKISVSKDQVELVNTEITRQIKKKKTIKIAFEKDIERFVFLTQSSAQSKDISLKVEENKAANILGFYICETVDKCDKAWLSAKQFVLEFSTTKLDSETDQLILSQKPFRDTDLSLSVSRLDMAGKQQLFLDLRCRKSSVGDELCAGVKAKKIRQSFSSYIISSLNSKD